MRSASEGTHAREHERRARTVATVACMFGVACAGALFFVAPTPDRLTRAVAQLPPGSQEVEYLRQRPFDAIGFLALSAATTTAPLKSRGIELAEVSAALALSPTDPTVLRSAVQRELSLGSAVRALDYAATLALVSPGDRADAFEFLRNRVGTPEWRTFFAKKLHEPWPLTEALLQHVCANDKTPQLIASHQMAWEVANRQFLSKESLLCIERRLVESGQTPAAYRLRLGASRNLSPRVDHVYNGGFEAPPSGSAFDWTINSGGEYRDGFVAAIRSGLEFGSSGHVLHVRFSGQPIRGPAAVQALALEPGKFTLSYRTREAGFTSAKVPVWTIRCAANQLVLTTAVAEASEAMNGWTTRATTFTIPTQCVGQTLRLEAQTRLSALEGVRGILVVDDVVISQVSTDS